jgi:predicted HAD superfamily Cof-like phosphohydrolase
MLENESEEPRIKLELSNESKELLERLRTQQKIETFARSASERGVLAQARLQSEADATSLVTALLAMNVESERQLYVARRERDTFSDEVDHLKRQVDACHTKIGELKNDADKSTTQKRELSEFLKNAMDENRALKASNRTVCVRDMFVRVLPHQERNDRPTVPSEAAIRLQTRIDAEEFVEKIEALYDDPLVSSLGKILHAIATHAPIRHDLHDRLPEFADALADNAVTNEGFAVLFGIDLEPVFQEAHAANLRKGDGPIVDGKLRKPEGWTPPDVVGVLRKQGWQPSSESKVDEPIPYALNCPVHGTLTVDDTSYGAGTDCMRCENAQYNGSEIDPVGEQGMADEPIHLMLGASSIIATQGNPVFSLFFATNDTSTIARCRQYMREGTRVIPEPVGRSPFPVCLIKRVATRPAAPSDAMLGRRYSVEIEFRKVN